MLRFKVFQYKISYRMSYLRALYDNFEILEKKFQWDLYILLKIPIKGLPLNVGL